MVLGGLLLVLPLLYWSSLLLVPLLIAAETTLVALQTGSNRPWTQASATLDVNSVTRR